MTLTVSRIIKPVIQQYLGSLAHLIETAQQFCEEKGIEEDALLQDRLAPDMHPLIWQFQMVSEFAARCASRLANHAVPEFPYEETNFEELKARVAHIREYVAEIDDVALDEGLGRIQHVPLPNGSAIEFPGPVYLSHFFMPNFFFHITTAYNILRKNGLPIGKFDFVGQMPQ
ncbi:MAG: DUF1993 family protein [Aestuariibacter sp.]